MWQIGEVLRACGQNPTEAEWKKYMGEDQGLLKLFVNTCVKEVYTCKGN